MTHIDHYIANKTEFDYWIQLAVNGKPEKLEISNDIFKPLIEPFREANPNVNIFNCKDCVSDMLLWVKGEASKLPIYEVVDIHAQEKTTKPTFQERLEQEETKRKKKK